MYLLQSPLDVTRDMTSSSRAKRSNWTESFVWSHLGFSHRASIRAPVDKRRLQLLTPRQYPVGRASIYCQSAQPSPAVQQPRVVIEYCTGCRWGLRAAWISQELLVTFDGDLGEIALRPGTHPGVFDVWVGSTRVWCREKMRRFPELKELKQLVRDVVKPDRDLGHSDVKKDT